MAFVDILRRNIISTQRYNEFPLLSKKMMTYSTECVKLLPGQPLWESVNSYPITRNHIEYTFLEVHVSMREYDAGATAGGCNEDDKKGYISLETLRFRHRFFIFRTKFFQFRISSISFKTASSEYL